MCSLFSSRCWQTHSCVLDMPVCLHFQQLEQEHRVALCVAKKRPPARVSHRRTWVQWLWWTAVQLKIDQGRSTGPVEPGEQSVPQRSLPAVPGKTRSVPLQGLSTDAKPTARRAGLVSVVQVYYRSLPHTLGSMDWVPESNGGSLLCRSVLSISSTLSLLSKLQVSK